MTAYSASQQALLAVKQIFAPVFAHSSAAESAWLWRRALTLLNLPLLLCFGALFSTVAG